MVRAGGGRFPGRRSKSSPTPVISRIGNSRKHLSNNSRRSPAVRARKIQSSYPRKRASRATDGGALPWTPAFAGVTMVKHEEHCDARLVFLGDGLPPGLGGRAEARLAQGRAAERQLRPAGGAWAIEPL